MVDENELRKSVDPWITVVALAIAGQLALVAFTLDSVLPGEQTTYVYLTDVMLVFSMASVGTFLLVRDPRRTKFSTSKLIDLGVGFTIVSLSFGGFAASITTKAIGGDELLISIIGVFPMIFGIVAYLIYVKFSR